MANEQKFYIGAPVRVVEPWTPSLEVGLEGIVTQHFDGWRYPYRVDFGGKHMTCNFTADELEYAEGLQEVYEAAAAAETKPETVLEEAQRLIYGERAASYGKARPSFQRVATLWSATTGYDITPEQVVLCMIQLKVAREVNKHDRDNIVDIAGYAGCFQKLADDE